MKGEKEAAKPAVKVAAIGDGTEAKRMAAALELARDVDLVGSEIVEHADGLVRRPVLSPPSLARFEEIIRVPGLAAIEIEAPPEKRLELAQASIKAGLFTSIDPPARAGEIEELKKLARAYGVGFRVRLLPFYYPPYLELIRLADEEALGPPTCVKLGVKRGGGPAPADLDPVRWIIENEIGFLALASRLLGKVCLVHARLERASTNNNPASSVISMKFKEPRRFGYFQLDFCPDMFIKTETDPVHRFIELTSAGGVIMSTRGEGQTLKMPALIVRGKSTTTAFEMIRDDWVAVYDNLAQETAPWVRGKRDPSPVTDCLMDALSLMALAKESAEKGDEVKAG